jgi:hypothetical protein
MIGIVIGSESAAAFDGFTRTGLDDKMNRQGKGNGPIISGLQDLFLLLNM